MKTIVVSTNNNPDYYFYSPYIKKAWNHWGWHLCTMITHDVDSSVISSDIIIQIPEMPGIRTETIAQASRLYAANVIQPASLIMTSDMDLLPLSDYWHPDPNKITSYGHDLTDRTFYPMGYMAMTGENWRKIMNLTGSISNDFMRDYNDPSIPHSPKSENWEQWWNYDWSLLTQRIKPFTESIVKIDRGRRTDSPFAYGRIDRGDSMKLIPKPWIDAHCENVNTRHPDKLNKFLNIFEEIYGTL